MTLNTSRLTQQRANIMLTQKYNLSQQAAPRVRKSTESLSPEPDPLPLKRDKLSSSLPLAPDPDPIKTKLATNNLHKFILIDFML